jgi:hypothetical protein
MNDPPHRRVERRELVVARWDHRAEVLLHQIGVLAQRGVHVGEQDALSLEILSVLVVHDLGFVLRSDAGEILALGLGDTELLVGVLHLLGQIVPVVDLLPRRLQVVVDVLEVDVGHVHREPLGHRLALEEAEASLAHLAHPSWLALPPRDLVDHSGVDALHGFERVLDVGVAPAEAVLGEIEIERGHVRLRSGAGEFPLRP